MPRSNDLTKPWEGCPTVWKRFLERKGWVDPEFEYSHEEHLSFQKKFIDNKAVQVHFEWFYYGFQCGGNS